MRIPVPLSLFCYKSQSLITAAMPLSTPHQHHLLLSKKTQVCISSSLFWSSISHPELSNSTRKVSAFSSAQTRKQRDGKAYSQISSRMVLSPHLPLFVVFLLPMKDRYTIHFTSLAPENGKILYMSPVFTAPIHSLLIL